jgi:hypothetical protein
MEFSNNNIINGILGCVGLGWLCVIYGMWLGYVGKLCGDG